MVKLYKITFSCIWCALSIINHTAFAQSTNKTKITTEPKNNSVIILGPKNGTNLQSFQGFYSGLHLSYFKKMPEAEKAILGLIATYAGTDCDLENNATDTEHARYSCKLTLALGIGYQCSDEYLAYERKWFRNDSAVLNELKDCSIRPSGANYVTSFGKIILTKSPGTIKIYFTKNTFSIRTMISSEWTETFYFKVDADEVHLIKRTHTKPKVEKLKDSDSL